MAADQQSRDDGLDDLNPRAKYAHLRVEIDLHREFGFTGRVSDEALAEIAENERRQARAQWQAIWWWFR